MQLKDYYKILDLTPAATALQVKKSFRQLALRHHPDKNPGSALSEAKFKEIHEAYEILADPDKRADYNYKRWYHKSLKKQFNDEPLTSTTILGECVRLHNYMLSVNAFRVNYDGLSYHIRQLLSQQNTAILLETADEKLRKKVIEELLVPAAVLPARYIQPVVELMLRLAAGSTALTSQVNAFSKQHKQKTTWQKYSALVVVAITLLLCWLIYRLA
ncbi:MAG: DnaJ domain-containing protein [Chitinophagaceae bacterium]